MNRIKIYLFRSTYTYLDKVDRPCLDYSRLEYMNCVSKEIRVLLDNAHLNCMPSSFADILNYKNLSVRNCTPDDQSSILVATRITIRILQHYSGRVVEGYEGKCLMPCIRQSVEAKHAKLSWSGMSKFHVFPKKFFRTFLFG